MKLNGYNELVAGNSSSRGKGKRTSYHHKVIKG